DPARRTPDARGVDGHGTDRPRTGIGVLGYDPAASPERATDGAGIAQPTAIMKPSRSEFVSVRGLRYHVREWGHAASRPLWLLHGWMDVSASFQFLVDELAGDYRVLAPDWRGFGLTQWASEGYWFPDYLGDLDALLRHFTPDAAVDIVGHSMGGNVASLFAGVRTARVRRLALLEGFGLPGTAAAAAPARYEKWLD